MKKIFTLLSLFLFTQIQAGDYYVKLKEEFVAKHFTIHQLTKLRIAFQQQLGSDKTISAFKQVAPSIAASGLNRVFFISISNISLAEIQKISSVEFAENVPEYVTSLTPNDPQLSSQWHLQTINAFNAWNVSTGVATATVAIVDNAIMRNHQDLAANIYTNPAEIAANNIDDDNNGYIDDVQGWDAADDDNNPNPPTPSFSHGTHCAGISAAATNNTTGIASIGYNCAIIPVKATADNSSPNSITDAASGVAYAIASGADVVSMSFGGGGYSAFMQQLFNAGAQQGIVFVAAAGNSNTSQIHYPAGYNHVIAVAASNPNDQKASFSNYGSWVDISAPGTNIFSTIPNNTTGTYGNMSGTSMACPLVAGLCVLMKANTPSLTPAQLETCLKQSADDIDALNPLYAGQLGSGRINALATLNCQTCNAVASFTSTDSLISYPRNSNVCFTSNGNGNGFNWSINGNNYSGNSACHTFASAGYYNVCNYATGSFTGCADTLCKSFTIYDTANITVCAPRYGNKWIFGTGNMLDFSADPPISSGGLTFTPGGEATSSVSDACGNLLSYSNGVSVWDRGHQIMPNGTGLIGHISTTNGAIYVPVPGSRNRYYLFTLTQASQNTANDGCYYHVIDIHLKGNGTTNDPKGDVLIKNQPVQRVSDFNTPVSEKMEVVRHANGIDFWLILHNNNVTGFPGPFNRFYVYHISANGISGPSVYSVGTAFPDLIHGVGDMEANNQGTKLAVCAIEQYGPADGFIQLFDFNKSTGAVSNPVNVGTALFNNFGVAFSPNDKNLFYQVSSTSFTNGQIKMFHIPTGVTSTVASAIPHIPFAMQLGPDGKIYVINITNPSGTWPSANALSTINNPDTSLASAVNYLYENVGLATEGGHNLPVFVKGDMFSIPPQVSTNDTICVSDTSQFDVDVEICSGLDGVLSYAWNFNDPASGSTNTSMLKSPKHKFSAPGLYQVKIVANASCYNDSITVPVLIRNCQSTPDPVTFDPVIDSVECPAPDSVAVRIGGGTFYRIIINGNVQALRSLDAPPGTYTSVQIPLDSNTPPFNICAVFYDDTTMAANDTVCRTISGSILAIPPVLADTNVCAGGNVTLSVGNNWNSYLWSGGELTSFISVSVAGNYSVTVTNAGGCSATADSDVSQTNLMLTVSLVNTNCGLSNGAVSVSPINGVPPFIYLWNTGATNDTISNLAAGIYYVTAEDANGCSSTLSANVNPSNPTTVSTTSNKSIMCPGDSALVCAPVGYTSYLWNMGQTTRCIYGKLAGNYYVTAVDNQGCSATSTPLAISVHTAPTVSISLSGDTLSAFNATFYQWYRNNVLIPNATSRIYIATQSGTYTVVVTDVNGCSATSTAVTVVVTGIENINEDRVIVYPNPSTNELNINLGGMRAELVNIYDVDGKLVSETKQPINNRIDVSNLSRGVYVAEVKVGDALQRVRWVKM